jgi:sodium-dependent dicarboxylate transporter 2/3/5
MAERQCSNEKGLRAISPAEERFERCRHTVGLFLGLCIAVLLAILPMPSLTPKAHTLAAIIGWIVVWWVTKPIPIPISALFGAALCVRCGVVSATKALGAFAEPPIFLFLGSFILAQAMTAHGLDKRFAYRILSVKYVRRSPSRLPISTRI